MRSGSTAVKMANDMHFCQAQKFHWQGNVSMFTSTTLLGSSHKYTVGWQDWNMASWLIQSSQTQQCHQAHRYNWIRLQKLGKWQLQRHVGHHCVAWWGHEQMAYWQWRDPNFKIQIQQDGVGGHCWHNDEYLARGLDWSNFDCQTKSFFSHSHLILQTSTYSM